jgi:hypothetical protein
METADGSSAVMRVILNTVSAVVAMDKKTFQNEALFLITLHLIQLMRDEKLITESEYHTAERQMLEKYQPLSGSLYT